MQEWEKSYASPLTRQLSLQSFFRNLSHSIFWAGCLACIISIVFYVLHAQASCHAFYLILVAEDEVHANGLVCLISSSFFCGSLIKLSCVHASLLHPIPHAAYPGSKNKCIGISVMTYYLERHGHSETCNARLCY